MVKTSLGAYVLKSYLMIRWVGKCRLVTYKVKFSHLVQVEDNLKLCRGDHTEAVVPAVDLCKGGDEPRLLGLNLLVHEHHHLHLQGNQEEGGVVHFWKIFFSFSNWHFDIFKKIFLLRSGGRGREEIMHLSITLIFVQRNHNLFIFYLHLSWKQENDSQETILIFVFKFYSIDKNMFVLSNTLRSIIN